MELQQTHRKINRPLVSLALVGLLVSITPQKVMLPSLQP